MSLSVSCKTCGHEAPVDSTRRNALLKRSPLVAGTTQARIEAALPALVCKNCGSREAELIQADAPHSEPRCADCGCAIPMARLEANPTATLCVQCQEQYEGEPEGLGKCPRCGCELVWRVRKSVGTASCFVGCVAFPDCCYIQRD